MGFRVAYADLARCDLREIVEYIAQDNPGAAIRMGDLLLNRAESLANQPSLGSLLRSGHTVRKLICTPYLILYEVDEAKQEIVVLRFWHGARDPRQIRLA